MLSPSHDRSAPPVKLSRSLEGLEKVIPPTSPLSLAGRPYYLQLDKPLPDKPLPDTPPMGHSTAWSNDTSTVGSSSRCSSRESSRYSTDNFPVFVRSGCSDDDDDDDDDDDRTSDPEDGKFGSSSIAVSKSKQDIPDPLEVFLADIDDEENDEDDDYDDEKRYGPEIRHTVTDWTQNRYGPNHYFREKKWDFFPELATPSALPGGRFPSCRPVSTIQSKPARRLNLSTFDFGRLNRSRRDTNTTERSGSALAQNVRDSIKSAVQWTRSKPSVLEKEKEKRRHQPRPSTARSERTRASQRTVTTSSEGTIDVSNSPRTPRSYEDVSVSDGRARKTPSMSTRSSTMGSPQSAPLPQRRKQLAVPLSPYQKHGATIWENPRRASHNVRSPRYYQNQRRWSSSLPSSSSSSSTSTSPSTADQSPRLTMTQSNPVLPMSPSLRWQLQRSTREYVRALQDGTSHMLDALDGAKRKVVDSRLDRRRAQLKAQIRLVGPVNPNNTRCGYGHDPWI